MNEKSMESENRVAGHSDFNDIVDLLQSAGLTIKGVKENLDHFIILKNGSGIVAVAGYEIYGDKTLLRSVAVEEKYRGKGFGKRITKEIISLVKVKKISEIYLLTETASHFFRSLGFSEVSRDQVDPGIKSSQEFRSICPSTAICMKMDLEVRNNFSDQYINNVREIFTGFTIRFK